MSYSFEELRPLNKTHDRNTNLTHDRNTNLKGKFIAKPLWTCMPYFVAEIFHIDKKMIHNI
jgi:hypothetical protein